MPSGSLRVRVYAGADIRTGKDHYLSEVIPAGPGAETVAEQTRARLVKQVEDGKHPKTNATVMEVITEHLRLSDMGEHNKETLRRYADKHVAASFGAAPSFGELTYSRIKPKTYLEFQAELRRCRDHCDGTGPVKHYASVSHRCDGRCKKHVCKPLAPATIRKIHFMLSAAFEEAVVWEWVPANPFEPLRKPPAPPALPKPPSTEDAARIVMHAWAAGYGAMIWLAMVTGVRRGELLALRRKHLLVRHTQLGRHDCVESACEHTLFVHRAVAHCGKKIWEKDTKSHQQRQIALDLQTAAVLIAHWDACERQAALVDCVLTDNSLLFSATPDGETWIVPDSFTQRYARWVKALGIDTCLKNLRHYSATELISAGVDIRTVAGRLGHSGGGVTTLKVYAAWSSAADQRASLVLMDRMPSRPQVVPGIVPTPPTQRTLPEKLADDLYDQIINGAIATGDPLPPMAELAAEHNVSPFTVHRAVGMLKQWGVIEVSRGKRAIVLPIVNSLRPAAQEADPRTPTTAGDEPVAPPPHTSVAAPPTAAPGVVQLELIELGKPIKRMSAQVDPTDTNALANLMRSAIRRTGRTDINLDDFEMAVYTPGSDEPITTVVMVA
ncbi:GntR family transcriptional regulator [Actinokineospora sp. HUAS TT18]|uniref:GntR family transcriptional regulator n=1 Tax=Actinokineospora sp. HUAS TT18 TaxID=3447451 RepID=UPI003F51C87B